MGDHNQPILENGYEYELLPDCMFEDYFMSSCVEKHRSTDDIIDEAYLMPVLDAIEELSSHARIALMAAYNAAIHRMALTYPQEAVVFECRIFRFSH